MSPGHLVAIATTPAGGESMVWRWYDAVILGKDAELDPVDVFCADHGIWSSLQT